MNGPELPPLEAMRTTDLGRIFRLVRKELTEILRDRRTIMTLVLMPLLLYPLLSLAFQQFLLSHSITGADDLDTVRIGFQTEDDLNSFTHLLGSVATLPEAQQKKIPDLSKPK